MVYYRVGGRKLNIRPAGLSKLLREVGFNHACILISETADLSQGRIYEYKPPIVSNRRGLQPEFDWDMFSDYSGSSPRTLAEIDASVATLNTEWSSQHYNALTHNSQDFVQCLLTYLRAP